MASIDVVKAANTAILAAVSVLKAAPDYPTDNRFEKTVITYATNFRFKARSDGHTNTIFDLRIDIKIARKDLADAMKFLSPLPELIGPVFMSDPTISGKCQTYDGDVTANLVTEVINGMTTIGWEITVPNVKM